jgi:hypothetical protein
MTDILDGLAPSHLMLFSDCAFLVYDSPLQAAMSSTELMRRFLTMTVPVRMGLALGTWHAQRFSFDSGNSLTITRAVFYGTGVVRATYTEKKAGKGCRIFVHSSLNDEALAQIRNNNIRILNTPEASPEARLELNYLHPNEGLDEMAMDMDVRLLKGFHAMHARLTTPIHPDVERQYTDTFDAINRMRQQLRRSQFARPQST